MAAGTAINAARTDACSGRLAGKRDSQVRSDPVGSSEPNARCCSTHMRNRFLELLAGIASAVAVRHHVYGDPLTLFPAGRIWTAAGVGHATHIGPRHPDSK